MSPSDPREKLITAEEAQSILDVCETMASVAAQMGLTTLLMGGDEPSLMDAIPGLARTVKALHAEVARRGAIIEGRTVAPTDAEIDAHHAAGGSWLTGDTVTWAPVSLRGMRDNGETEGCVWIALDGDGKPCAWPVVTP